MSRGFLFNLKSGTLSFIENISMKKKILFIAVLLVLLAAAFVVYKFYGPAVSTPSGEFLYIRTGSNYADVKKELVDKKYISSAFWFDKASGLLKYKIVKPGRYKMAKGMSIFKLVRMLRSGDQSQLNFVITKLRTKEDLARRIGNMFECDSTDMIRFLNSKDSLAPYGLDTNTVMAAAMPYTYGMNWNTSPGKIFQRLYHAYESYWTDARKVKADSIHLSPVEVITLASIIEEETLKKEDKYNIASVYLNRLSEGMPLQADPTIKFAMKNFALKRILSVHLKTESPYNTYIHTGLPPGPICTPGVETIDAVLDAPKTNYLYFVASSRFDGTSVFTSNLDDHNKYAREYQKELTRRMDSVKKAKATINAPVH